MRNSFIEVFEGTHANVARALNQFLEEKGINPSHVQSLTSFERSSFVPSVSLVLAYNAPLHGDMKSTAPTIVEYFVTKGPATLRAKEFKDGVNKRLKKILVRTVEAFAHYDDHETRSPNRMSWFAIGYNPTE